MRKPLIAIVCYTDLNRLGSPSHILPVAYTKAIEMAGGIPYIIPFTCETELLAQSLAPAGGCLFTGGIDIDPTRYQELKRPCCGRTDCDLDGYQFAAFRTALELGKPILGICRGAQLINVGLGGTLHQNIFSELDGPVHKHLGQGTEPGEDHQVIFATESRLHQLFGEKLTVNSRHHQAIKIPARDLIVTARADDGIIEAAQHRYLPIDLVQWHPELMMNTPNPAMLTLFQALVRKCVPEEE